MFLCASAARSELQPLNARCLKKCYSCTAYYPVEISPFFCPESDIIPILYYLILVLYVLDFAIVIDCSDSQKGVFGCQPQNVTPNCGGKILHYTCGEKNLKPTTTKSVASCILFLEPSTRKLLWQPKVRLIVN